MLSLSSGFNYFLCSEPVTLRYRHAGLRNYIKSQLHRDPTNGDYHISWENFVYLVEEIVLKDRKVAFNDLDDENDDEKGLSTEEANQGENEESELLKRAI